jgi:hypothetical protein
MASKLLNSQVFFMFITALIIMFVGNSLIQFIGFVSVAPLIPFIVVAITSSFLAKLFWSDGSPLEFINVVDHEMTHSLFALIFQRKVVELYANSNGTGHVMYESETSALSARLTSLAPYLISVGTILIITIQLIGASQFFIPLTLLGGVVTGFRTISLFKDARPHQTDFARTGYSWAIILVITSYLFFILIELAYANGGTVSIVNMVRGGANSTFEQISFLWDKIFTNGVVILKAVFKWAEGSLIPLIKSITTNIIISINSWRTV